MGDISHIINLAAVFNGIAATLIIILGLICNSLNIEYDINLIIILVAIGYNVSGIICFISLLED